MSDGIQSQLILCRTPDGQTRIQCRFENENVWLTQALMADLFQVTAPTINEHLKDIYAEEELPATATIRKFRIVRSEGVRQVCAEGELQESATCKEYLQVRTEGGRQIVREWEELAA